MHVVIRFPPGQKLNSREGLDFMQHTTHRAQKRTDPKDKTAKRPDVAREAIGGATAFQNLGACIALHEKWPLTRACNVCPERPGMVNIAKNSSTTPIDENVLLSEPISPTVGRGVW